MGAYCYKCGSDQVEVISVTEYSIAYKCSNCGHFFVSNNKRIIERDRAKLRTDGYASK